MIWHVKRLNGTDLGKGDDGENSVGSVAVGLVARGDIMTAEAYDSADQYQEAIHHYEKVIYLYEYHVMSTLSAQCTLSNAFCTNCWRS